MNITPAVQDFFKEQKVEIQLFPSQRTKKFQKVESFIEFYKKEFAYWQNCNYGNLNYIRDAFYQICTLLDRNDSDEHKIANLQEAINRSRNNRAPYIYSETEEGLLIKETYNISPEQAVYIYDYIFNKSLHMGNYDGFMGAMRAYNKVDRDKILKNEVAAQKQLLEDLRNSYTSQLEGLCLEFFSRSEKVEHKFKSIQEQLDGCQKLFTSDTNDLLEKSTQRINELEALYQEKLRLKAPAEYWNDMHKKYKDRGDSWRNWSLWIGGIVMIFLTVILYNLPEALFGNGFNSIKTTIVFALIASIGIYLVRLFVMLSTSAYHLARDAHERYQLTHVFLSLLELDGIKETERSIVLQSIFSRADTGLLKGDSSPAFPGMIEQIIKNVKSK